MSRIALLSRLAVLALLAAPFAAPASAEQLELGGVPLVNTTVVTATNTAAGIGNVADQRVNKIGGPSFLRGPAPLVDTTVVTATNTAAGIGNFAGQNVSRVGSPSFGPAPLFKSTTVDASNLAAGIGNFAGQAVRGVR